MRNFFSKVVFHVPFHNKLAYFGKLRFMDVDVDDLLFKEYRDVINSLKETYGERIISCRGPGAWPGGVI